MTLLPRRLVLLVGAALAAALLVGLFFQRAGELAAPSPAEEQFALEVWPVLESKCFACHGADSSAIKGS